MKYLKYNILQSMLDGQTPILMLKRMNWSEANEEIAKKEAYNSDYTIEDDGTEEISEPTWQDKIEAQVAYNSIMLGTLIEEV